MIFLSVSQFHSMKLEVALKSWLRGKLQKIAAFLLQGAGFFFREVKCTATLYFLEFPSFHVPFSFGFKSSKMFSKVPVRCLKVST